LGSSPANEAGAGEAARFVIEYDELIAELEKQAGAPDQQD
jgi:hypothetical protein